MTNSAGCKSENKRNFNEILNMLNLPMAMLSKFEEKKKILCRGGGCWPLGSFAEFKISELAPFGNILKK